VILVTVGTAMPFDELLAEVDRLIEAGVLDEPVVCQYGQSTYRMAHAEQFMASPSIADLIEGSSMVITHGGATVIQLLLAKKNFVAFPNPRGAGDHQTGFLQEVSKVATLSWSSDVRDLGRLYAERRKLGPPVLASEIPRASDVVGALLQGA